VGVRNVMVTYTYYSDKNALAEQIVKDRVCVDCMLAYGNAMAEGATSEKFGDYTVQFREGPYAMAIKSFKERIEKNLNQFGVDVNIKVV